MNSVKGKVITKCVILMSMTYLQCNIEIQFDYTLMECKAIYLFRKLLPLNLTKLNLNLVTKLKLLSMLNITNIDINFLFS